MTQPTPVERALMDVAWIAEEIARNGWKPGRDVTLFRRLRELHRCLGSTDGERLDPHRLVRYMLFNGLAEMSSWTDGTHYCTTHEVYGDFCVEVGE